MVGLDRGRRVVGGVVEAGRGHEHGVGRAEEEPRRRRVESPQGAVPWGERLCPETHRRHASNGRGGRRTQKRMAFTVLMAISRFSALEPRMPAGKGRTAVAIRNVTTEMDVSRPSANPQAHTAILFLCLRGAHTD